MKNRILFVLLAILAASAAWLARIDLHALYVLAVVSLPIAWVTYLVWVAKR